MKPTLEKGSSFRKVVLLMSMLSGAPYPQMARAASFVDPSAVVQGNVTMGDLVYVAPFATLLAGEKKITIGEASNVQDSATLDASNGNIKLGEQAIVAHGATVKGPARIGKSGRCPTDDPCPSFVGFNAEVGGSVQKDAMVGHLARVARGVVIRSGLKVLPGKNVTNKDQATDPVLGKVAAVTAADRMFMEGVIEVNEAFADDYDTMKIADPNDVHGIGPAPITDFNEGDTPQSNCTDLDMPTCAQDMPNAGFRNRIIGDVRLRNTEAQLDDLMGSKISVRGDEGEPFKVGTIAYMDSRVTFHALEHTHITLGNNGRYDYHSLVHGGPNTFNGNTTQAGDGFKLGAHAVFFNSRVGDNSRVGFKTVVLNSDFGANPTTIGDCKIVSNGAQIGDVEWCY